MQVTYDKLRSTVLANLGIDHTVTGDLLQLYFAESLAPESLACFFSQYDIELLEFQNVWLLSKLATRLHYAGVPKEEFPRVKGIVKRFMVENGRHFCVLPGVLEAFNRSDVAVMLLNGTAIKVFYEPAETRYYSTIDFLVQAGEIYSAGHILEKLGFRLQGTFWGQHVYRKNDVSVAIHSEYLKANMLTGDLADIWQHSSSITLQGKKAFVPCTEMMLLILLVQGLEACCSCISNCLANSFVNEFIDSKFFLSDASLNWEKFIDMAKKSQLTLHVRLMLDVLNQLYPGVVAGKVLEALPYTDKDIANVQKLITYNFARKKATEARDRRDRMEYYCNGVAALWNLNCFYGNRSSLFSNVTDFPQLIAMWNNHRGIKGLLSKVGGFK
ncbi:MAG: nucleotidyltransferase family protein [Acidaminococcaceae bacterium]|nr:nucleotidyltransferase family protein [Acidaminococcaceae bacterium]